MTLTSTLAIECKKATHSSERVSRCDKIAVIGKDFGQRWKNHFTDWGNLQIISVDAKGTIEWYEMTTLDSSIDCRRLYRYLEPYFDPMDAVVFPTFPTTLCLSKRFIWDRTDDHRILA